MTISDVILNKVKNPKAKKDDGKYQISSMLQILIKPKNI